MPWPHPAQVCPGHPASHPCWPSGSRLSSQDTVSVHRPSFYAERFFKFMSNTVFRKNSCESPWPCGLQGPGARRREGGGQVPCPATWSALGVCQGPGPDGRVVRQPPLKGQRRAWCRCSNRSPGYTSPCLCVLESPVVTGLCRRLCRAVDAARAYTRDRWPWPSASRRRQGYVTLVGTREAGPGSHRALSGSPQGELRGGSGGSHICAGPRESQTWGPSQAGVPHAAGRVLVPMYLSSAPQNQSACWPWSLCPCPAGGLAHSSCSVTVLPGDARGASHAGPAEQGGCVSCDTWAVA